MTQSTGNNVVNLFNDEVQIVDYDLNDQDVLTFLRVLTHIQSKSMNLSAEIKIDLDTLTIKTYHCDNPKQMSEDVQGSVVFSNERAIDAYLPSLNFVVGDSTKQTITEQLIAETKYAIESLHIEDA
jgi:hypothetical protein